MDDRLWSFVERLLPSHRPGTCSPVPIDVRRCLQGILVVLFTGIGWEDLPQELGFVRV
ncbi:transposase [Stackebrandtia soli]|uniref:transposase n=1 Tax=Stackebrandtia soli TaxID=1892856 RepID=UPI0039E954DF